MHQLVSIVIPAYNRVQKIKPALSSIIAQDYDNIEIIVVDDGSSDGTRNVAENVLRASGRQFKIIGHDTNMGVSAARNTGLSSASGEYVIFFDSDDAADPEFVSVLLSAVTENDSDAAFCGFRNRYESTGGEHAVPVGLEPSRRYSAEELTVMTIFRRIHYLMCTTMFKTNFLRAESLKFTVGCAYLEDYEFLIKALSRCGSINFSAGCHYIYIRREEDSSENAWQTSDKVLRRRVYIAEVICREARYLAEYAESAKVRKIALNYMLADGLIKTMNVAIWRRDKEEFYRILRAPETRRALVASLRYLRRDPEVFCKAAVLLTVPRFYFWMRSKHFD